MCFLITTGQFFTMSFWFRAGDRQTSQCLVSPSTTITTSIGTIVIVHSSCAAIALEAKQAGSQKPHEKMDK